MVNKHNRYYAGASIILNDMNNEFDFILDVVCVYVIGSHVVH